MICNCAQCEHLRDRIDAAIWEAFNKPYPVLVHGQSPNPEVDLLERMWNLPSASEAA